MRITKKSVKDAENRFYRERQRWGENNLATIRAQIAYYELREVYEAQERQKAERLR